MSELFTSDEAEVMRMILRKMGNELRPHDLRGDAQRKYNIKVEAAIGRTMTWLELLKPPTNGESIETGGPSSEFGQPDTSHQFRAS